MQIILDTKEILSLPEILSLLQESVYAPTPEKLSARAEGYRQDGSISALCLMEDSVLLGLLICREQPDLVEILDLAVRKSHQRQGLGRKLLGEASIRFRKELFAETDDDAVEFYSRCGFVVRSLGEKYPGIVRYQCRRQDEILDLYDQNRCRLGKFHRRGDPLPESTCLLGAEIWVISGQKLLLTQRSPQKTHPYQWEGTGGLAQAGEDSLACIKRELLEETGLDISKETPLLLLQYRRPAGFTDVYAIRKKVDLSKLTLQPSEVMGAKLVSLNEFDLMCHNGQVVSTVEGRFRLIEDQIEALMEPLL